MKEHQHLEWKEAWRDDFLRWICGFANAEGGVLQIGKNDQGHIVGLPQAAKLLEDLPNKIRDVLGIIVGVNLRREKGGEFLEIVVAPYPHPISYRGHYFMRSGSTLQELKGATLDRFLLRRHGRTWDGVPVPGVKTNHLSPTAIRRFRALADSSGRLDPADLRLSKTALLEKLQLTEGAYLKRAAVLLFHEDPERFVTGAFVKIGYFRSATDLAWHDTLHGDLFSQATKTMDLLRTKYLKAVISYQGIQRVERFPVPDAALREAVLNALVHRDYAVGAPMQIRVHDDRLKIWNPAVLPEGWTIKTLLREHPSTPFNPAIASVFFRSGEIETWGRGIQRIFQACKNAGSPKPVLRHDGSGLWIEFPYDREYLAGIAADHATADAAAAITRRESGGESGGESAMTRQIFILLGEEPLSKADLAKKLGKAKPTRYLNELMAKLVQTSHVAYTLPDKPHSRLQKYRLTAQGRARLNRKG